MSFYTRFMICAINGNPNYQGDKQELLSTPDFLTAKIYLKDPDTPFGAQALLGLREDNQQWQLLYAEEDQEKDPFLSTEYVTQIGDETELIHCGELKLRGPGIRLDSLRSDALDELHWGEKEIQNPVFLVKRDHAIPDYWRFGIEKCTAAKTSEKQMFKDPEEFIKAVSEIPESDKIHLHWNRPKSERSELSGYSEIYSDCYSYRGSDELFLLQLEREEQISSGDWDDEPTYEEKRDTLGVYSNIGAVRSAVAKAMTKLKSWDSLKEEIILTTIEVNGDFDIDQIREDDPF